MIPRKRSAVTALTASTVFACSIFGELIPGSAAAVTVSPLSGTPTATPQTQISFLGASASSLSAISVAGSVSGRHRGRLRSYSLATGASFLPSTPFTPGERVTVSARWRVPGHGARRLSSTFTVAQPGTVTLNELPVTPGTASDVQTFLSEPALHPPVLTVHQAASARSASGLLFLGPFLGPGQWGPAIYDNAGNLVWFQPLPPGEHAADFRTQTYRGKAVLSWWQGHTNTLGFGLGEVVIADSHYRTLARVQAGNGLQADGHEVRLARPGSALVMAYSPVVANLASIGGPAHGLVLDCVIQEVDIRTGLVMWEWHSLGHVDVAESYSNLPALVSSPYDYFHVNSVDTDSHGNLLISARNTSALYQVSARTGAIMWRLGGKNSSFMLGAGVPFAYQHNALWLPDGKISLYDDEGSPPVKPPSRSEVIRLDRAARTATLTAQYVRAPSLVSSWGGSAQSLARGNWLVGWGSLPQITEFDAQGHMIFDAQLPRGDTSLHVYREVWSGKPSERPRIAARVSACPAGAQCLVASSTAVYASWNGATDVATWQLLTGSSAAHLTAVSITPKSGFETVIPSPSAAFVRVRALNAAGKVLGTSKPVRPTSG